MSEPFLGELKLVAFGVAPKGWTQCSGQTLPINTNQALFALLGTTYGGNGQTTFALPDLRGRAPVHFGQNIVQGERGGEEAHTLITPEMPLHVHLMQAQNSQANTTDPSGHVLANTQGANLAIYNQPGNPTAMFAGGVTQVGGGQPHTNQSPYLVMTWIIALQGIFPSRN